MLSWANLLQRQLERAADGHRPAQSALCRQSLMTLSKTSITVAQMVPAGGFTLPGAGPAAVQLFSRLPAFCRVAATLTPLADSDIKMEVWLPAASWHGKFQAVGNGGWRRPSAMARWHPEVQWTMNNTLAAIGIHFPKTPQAAIPSARSWEAIGTIPCGRVDVPLRTDLD